MATEKKSSISQVNGKFIDNSKPRPIRGQHSEAGKPNIDPSIHEKSKSSDSFRGSHLRVSSQRKNKNSGIEDEDELSPTLPELSPQERSPVPDATPGPEAELEEDFQAEPASIPSHRPKQKSIKTIDELMASSKPDLEG